MGSVTETEIRQLLESLEGTRLLIASEENGAPESAWGDTFCFYDPEGTEDQKLPFATIVTRDTPGWDEASRLDPPGRFRVNIAVGRDLVPAVSDAVDYSQADVLLPHPQYGSQGWVSVVNPDLLDKQLETLIREAHDRAADRHRWRRWS